MGTRGDAVERGDLIGGRYRLDAEIGSGGTGAVWRATDQETEATVALKRISTSVPASDGRLRAEVAIASLLDHPNIAPVRRLVEHDGEPWLVMAYAAAPDLAALTAAGPLAPHRVAGIGAQAAGALAYAHSPALGVVHRAVTPFTVLAGAGDHVVLTGFGIPSTGASPPDVAYVAPEVANGLEGGPQADVFSLGATLYAAVEGHPPWGDGDPEQTRAAAMKGVVAPPRRAGLLGPVLMRMLESRPRERPTAAEAAQQLAEVARSEPGREGGEHARLRRLLRITVAAATVVVLAAVALVVWQRPLSAAFEPAPVPALGDLATADPCALIRPEPFDRFGQTTMESDAGNFDRCDVTVDIGADRVVAQVQFVRSSAVLPEGAPEDRDGMVIVRGAPTGGQCVRTVRLTDGNDVRVIVQTVRGAPPDLCAVADVGTDTALEVLARGTVPRRPVPFEPRSLAVVDACGLLEPATVATVPGLTDIPPDPGFAGWDCDWENLTTGASVEVTYDRNKGISSSAGKPIKVAGRDAAARADEDGLGCDVTILHRSYTDPSGSPADELLIVKVDQPVRVPDPCVQGVAVATVAAEHLPK